jgi:hypothetical protein
MGFSHGSVAALLSNLERFQKVRGTPGVQFAAHISVYGLCRARLRGDENLARPLLMLHGMADDFVPLGPCREYAERLTKARKNVRMIEYPDAHHVFDAPAAGQVTKIANRRTAAWCRFAETDGGLVNEATQKPLTPADECWKTGRISRVQRSGREKGVRGRDGVPQRRVRAEVRAGPCSPAGGASHVAASVHVGSWHEG